MCGHSLHQISFCVVPTRRSLCEACWELTSSFSYSVVHLDVVARYHILCRRRLRAIRADWNADHRRGDLKNLWETLSRVYQSRSSQDSLRAFLGVKGLDGREFGLHAQESSLSRHKDECVCGKLLDWRAGAILLSTPGKETEMEIVACPIPRRTSRCRMLHR